MILDRLWPWAKNEKHESLLANEALFTEFDQNRPIESYEFVSFDTELTGLNPKKDQIISIGAVRIKNLRIVAGDNFFAYTKPTAELPKNTTLIHGITPEQIELAPPLEIVLPQFINYCGNSLLVGHYVAIDVDFVNRAARKHLGGRLNNPCVDTMKLTQTYQEHQRRGYIGVNPGMSFNLNSLARLYDLPLFAQHDALEDALQTAYLFLYLIKRLTAAGYVTLRDIYVGGLIGPKVYA